MLEIPNICYILKSWGFKDVKYDIPMPIELVPTMQKKLFTSSFQAKFLKIRFTKSACTLCMLIFYAIFFPPILHKSRGHIWAKM